MRTPNKKVPKRHILGVLPFVQSSISTIILPPPLNVKQKRHEIARKPHERPTNLSNVKKAPEGAFFALDKQNNVCNALLLFGITRDDLLAV